MFIRLDRLGTSDPGLRDRIATRVVYVIAPTVLVLAVSAIVMALTAGLTLPRFIGAFILTISALGAMGLTRANRPKVGVAVLVAGLLAASAFVLIKNGIYAPGALGVIALSSLVGTIYGLRRGVFLVGCIFIAGMVLLIAYDSMPRTAQNVLGPQLHWAVISLWCLFALVASSVPVGLMEEALLNYQKQTVELERAKQEAQDRLHQFEAVFDQAFQLMGLLSPDGKLLKANATALRFLGVKNEDVIGKDFADSPWWFDEDRPLIRDAIRKASLGETVRFRSKHPDKNGCVRIIDFSLSPFRDSQNQVVYLIPEGRDITEMEAAQANLRQVQKMESMGMLASGVAHDVNNMLMGIMSASAMLEKRFQNGNDAQGMKYLNIINTASNRAAELVTNLLRFARKAPIERKKTDLNAVAEVAASLLAVSLGKSINLEFKPHPEPLPVTVDITAFEQAIVNLGVNARDAMPSGGTLTLALDRVELNGNEPALLEFERTAGTYAVVRAIDTGFGMESETLKRIFEPFFTTKQDKGTGLGLPSVYGTVKAHGGAIEVKSEVGVGTHFYIYIPIDNS